MISGTPPARVSSSKRGGASWKSSVALSVMERGAGAALLLPVRRGKAPVVGVGGRNR
jgi:hypothetical protein